LQQPSWDDPTAGGTMVRGALWLIQVVGEGNTFTKNDIREAFPGISQADRRVRDLRSYGWIMYSSVEDASLSSEDQRFVSSGVPVWDPKARRANAPTRTVSAKERQAVLKRDGHMCTLCGISGGEPYPDDPVSTAVLAVSRRTVNLDSGREESVLITECKRCKSGEAPPPLGVDDAVASTADLSPSELRRLLRWMDRGRRGSTELDRAWATYLRVPSDRWPEVVDRIKVLHQSDSTRPSPGRRGRC
jgi:hypothetical protein